MLLSNDIFGVGPFLSQLLGNDIRKILYIETLPYFW